MKIFKILLFIFLLVACLLIVQLNVLFYKNNYPQFIAYISHAVGKDSWQSFLQQRFSINKFLLCRKVILGFDILFILTAIFLLKTSAKLYFLVLPIAKQFKKYVISFYRSFTSLPKFYKVSLFVLLLFIIIKAVWYAFVLPLQYDEMWTYNYFTSNQWWQSFYLPGNNHKLYTSIAWWFNQLPFAPGFLMRLPNIFAGIITVLLFINLTKKYFSLAILFIGVTWFATTSPVGIYIFLARSYIYVLLFTLLLIKFTLKLIENKKLSKVDWLFYAVIIILGYWANLVFFFGHLFITLNILFFILKERSFLNYKKLFLAHVAAAIILVLLYLPDIFGQHFFALMDRAFIPGKKPNYFWRCIKYNSYFQWGRLGLEWLSGLLLGFSLFIVFYKKNLYKNLLAISLTGILLLPLFTFVVNDLIMHVAIYLTIYFSILIMCLLQFCFRNIKILQAFTVIICIAIAFINSYSMNNLGYLNYSRYQNVNSKKTAEVMLQNRITNCYLFFNLYKPAIVYYYKISKNNIEIKMAASQSVDYTAFDPQHKYLCIIIDKEHPQKIDSLNYELIRQDTLVSVWKRK